MRRLECSRRTLAAGVVLCFVVASVGCVASDEVTGVSDSIPGSDDGAVGTQLVPVTTITSTTTSLPDARYGGIALAVWGTEGDLHEDGPLSSADLWGVMQPGVRVWLGDRYGPDVLEVLPTFENGGLVENPDGTMTVRYQIHPEAVWSDGVPVTGDDIAFTHRWIMEYAEELNEYLDAPDEYPTDEMLLVDPTLFLVQPKSFEYTLREVSWAWWWLFDVVLPSHALEGTVPSDWVDRLWPQATMWIFERGEPWIYRRNPRHWATDPDAGDQLPYLEAQDVQPMRPDDVLEAFLTDDDVDVLAEVILDEDILAAIDQGRFDVLPGGGSYEYLLFNFSEGRSEVNPDSWNDHLEYRQAVMHAIDRQRICDELFGGAIEPVDSYLSPISPSLSSEPWADYPYDAVKARGLISGLCDRLGRDCDAEAPSMVIWAYNTEERPYRSEMGALIEEMLEDVGVEVEFMEVADPEDAVERAAWDVILAAWGAGPGTPGLIEFHEDFLPEYSIEGWGTPGSETDTPRFRRFRELVDGMTVTFDEADVANLIREAEQILADEMGFIPLFPPPIVWLIKPDHLHIPERQVYVTEDSWDAAFWYSIDPNDDLHTEP